MLMVMGICLQKSSGHDSHALQSYNGRNIVHPQAHHAAKGHLADKLRLIGNCCIRTLVFPHVRLSFCARRQGLMKFGASPEQAEQAGHVL